MSKSSGVLLVTTVVVCLLGLGAFASTAAAAPLQCGDVITENVKLDADLTDCPDDGLVVGADRITINLNGHEVSTDCEPVDCAGRVGIDNGGGFDRVRIRNGSVRGFEQNILLRGANRNTLARIEIRGGRYIFHEGSNSLVLEHSDQNVIKDSVIRNGDPAVLLTASDRNRIARTTVRGGISIRVGDALYMLDGSDDNTVVDSELDGGGAGGTLVRDSVRNVFKRNYAYGYAGALQLIRSGRTLIVGNEFDGGQGCGICVGGDRNTIRGNDGGFYGNGGIYVSGDRNLVVGNDAVGGFFSGTAIGVVGGDRNVIRENDADGSYESPVIHVREVATRTSLVGNSASGGADFSEPGGSGDGVKVDAPGTLVHGNTATDNADLGINAVDGVIDGGDNRAFGNGDPRQCVGVVCTP